MAESGGALSGALSAETGQLDADLARVVDAWPGLSEKFKASILAVVEATDVKRR